MNNAYYWVLHGHIINIEVEFVIEMFMDKKINLCLIK